MVGGALQLGVLFLLRRFGVRPPWLREIEMHRRGRRHAGSDGGNGHGGSGSRVTAGGFGGGSRGAYKGVGGDLSSDRATCKCPCSSFRTGGGGGRGGGGGGGGGQGGRVEGRGARYGSLAAAADDDDDETIETWGAESEEEEI